MHGAQGGSHGGLARRVARPGRAILHLVRAGHLVRVGALRSSNCRQRALQGLRHLQGRRK